MSTTLDLLNKNSLYKQYVPSVVGAGIALAVAIPLTLALSGRTVTLASAGTTPGKPATVVTEACTGPSGDGSAGVTTASVSHVLGTNTSSNGGSSGSSSGNNNTTSGGSAANNGNTQTNIGGLVGGVSANVATSALNNNLNNSLNNIANNNNVLSGNDVSLLNGVKLPILSGNDLTSIVKL